MMRSANPALNDKTFEGLAARGEERMSIEGTVHKTGLCLLILGAAAAWVWGKAMAGNLVLPAVWVGTLGGFILALVTIFKKEWSPVTVPVYSGLEGLALGGISALFERQYPGIVLQAVSLTFGTLFSLLAAYRSGLIKATENFKLGLFAATGGICLIYLAGFVLGFFGLRIPAIHESGPIGIGFSLVVVVIAALNLVMDFDFIEHGAESGAPKYMEWYGAFGLMVTLVWLYLEMIRLLAKMRERR
jgi:uncharacterized YccA/Bax inhibitor family protein